MIQVLATVKSYLSFSNFDKTILTISNASVQQLEIAMHFAHMVNQFWSILKKLKFSIEKVGK